MKWEHQARMYNLIQVMHNSTGKSINEVLLHWCLVCVAYKQELWHCLATNIASSLQISRANPNRPEPTYSNSNNFGFTIYLMIYLFNCHYLKFILGGIRSTYDSDLQHAKISLRNIVC